MRPEQPLCNLEQLLCSVVHNRAESLCESVAASAQRGAMPCFRLFKKNWPEPLVLWLQENERVNLRKIMLARIRKGCRYALKQILWHWQYPVKIRYATLISPRWRRPEP